MTAGGPMDGQTWSKNSQHQITCFGEARVFLFLEARNVKTDMRDVEGLQTEPDYPVMGFYVCKAIGDHVLLGPDKPEILFTCEPKKGDGVYLELGKMGAGTYVVIPFTAEPGFEHEYALTCYTDIDCDFVKIDPNRNLGSCLHCTDHRTFARVTKKLASLEKKFATLKAKEEQLKAAGKFGIPRPQAAPPPPPSGMAARPTSAPAMAMPPPPMMQAGGDSAVDRMFNAADVDGDGYVSMADMENFRRYYQEVDTNADGTISAAELKKATLSLEMKVQNKAAQFRSSRRRLRWRLRRERRS